MNTQKGWSKGKTSAIRRGIGLAGIAAMLLCARPAASQSPWASRFPDFNGDGYGDMAVGVPNEDVRAILGNGMIVDAGAVNVMYGTRTGLGIANNQLLSQSPFLNGEWPENDDGFGSSKMYGDFNGDGYTDLAVSAPGEDVGAVVNAGLVHIFYGSPNGLTNTGSQRWTQNDLNGNETAETGDMLGVTMAAGDFNADGYSDLAIAAPYEDVNGVTDAGVVHVLFGSQTGLTAAGNQVWHQDSAGILDQCEAGDRFGYTLAAANFDGDFGDDLAIAAPYEDIPNLFGFSIVDAGAVNVIYSAAGGLSAARNQFWHQDSSGILDQCEDYDHFGYALAAGRFSAGEPAALAVGVPFEDVVTNGRNVVNAGAVQTFYSQYHVGLNSGRNQFIHQDTLGVPDQCEDQDRFGAPLMAGNFNNNRVINDPLPPLSYDDLVIGVTGEDIGTVVDAGAVQMLAGDYWGLTGALGQFWHQGLNGLADVPETNDLFGCSFWKGDFNGDGYLDLAIGVELEDVGAIVDAGGVQVLHYDPARVQTWTTNQQLWSQNGLIQNGFFIGDILDVSEAGDWFGFGWR